jgi:hypothetical protein
MNHKNRDDTLLTGGGCAAGTQPPAASDYVYDEGSKIGNEYSKKVSEYSENNSEYAEMISEAANSRILTKIRQIINQINIFLTYKPVTPPFY